MPVKETGEELGLQGPGHSKLRTMKVKTFDEANLLALEDAVNAWLEGSGEETFVRIVWDHDHPDYTAMIFYTEE